jgi:hypothetical protein
MELPPNLSEQDDGQGRSRGSGFAFTPVESTRGGGGVLRAAAPLLLAIAGGVLLAVLARVYRDWIAADPVPHWDEALHLLLGELLAADLRHGDLWALAYDIYRMSTWPPVHATMLALVFLVTGPSTVAGRLLSWFSFAGLAGVTGLLAHRLAPKPNAVAPAVAVILLATCTPLAPFAGQAMLECLGLLLLSVTLVAYDIDARRHASPATQAGLAVASIATYLVRLNYGLLVLMALILDAAASVPATGLRSTWRRRRVVAALWICFVVLWFAHPTKIVATWQTLVNAPFTPPAGAPKGPLFAPWAMVETVGWPVVFGLVLVLLSVSAWWANRSLRFLVLVTALQLLLVAFHQSRVIRHIFPVVPPLVILCGWLAARWAAGASDRQRSPARGGIVVALVLLLAGYRLVISLDHLERPHAAVASTEWRRIGAAVARLADGTKILLVGDSRLATVEPTGLDWQLAGELGILDPSRAGALGEIGRGDAALRLLRLLDRRGLALPAAERVVRRSVASDRSRSLYVTAPLDAPPDSVLPAIETLLVQLEIDHFSTTILVTSPAPPLSALRHSLTTLLTRRGFVPTGRINVTGLCIERFDRVPRQVLPRQVPPK